MTRAYLGLGANLGDRLENLQRAVALLADCDGIEVLRSSRVYETEPLGGPPQPKFLNAVVEIDTKLQPRKLLDRCRAVEEELGRERRERWGPRTIDIDILTFGRREVNEPDLVIPHPRMHERGFVLAPLMELNGNPQLPGDRSVKGLRLGPAVLHGVHPFAPPLAVGP
jgi:2-amino-4-hydroxy-6-hydroxymethyldihydropteridine diphosphokinase